MPKFLVIGGTSTVGAEVALQLPANGAQVRAMVRNPDTVSLPPHVEVVRGDLTAPETLDAALAGIDGVFLIWTAAGDTAAAAIERIAKRTRRIVFLSAPLKTPHPMFQRALPNPIATVMAEIERLIETAGMEFTYLRPGMFASNAGRWWGAKIRAGELIRWPYLDAPTAPIDERDMAAVGVRALCDDGHAGAEYLITGSEVLTHRDQLATIALVIGRPVEAEEITAEQAVAELPDIPAMLLRSWEGCMEAPALITTTVAEVTGRPPYRFEQWVRDHVNQFESPVTAAGV
jgi:uncharacterized protein YbjT (DUF2867 family)